MEQHEWRVEFSWIKAHAGHRGNELADQLAKEAANYKNIEECYTKIPKSAVLSELKEQSVQQWQNEWERSSNGAIKSFFPKIEDRLKLRLNATPYFSAIVTGHGNIKSYLYKYEIIIDNPMCPCRKGDQTVDHILFDCTVIEQERDKLKAAVTRTENWPMSYNKLTIKYFKNFKEYMDKIIWNKE
jgi:hypothetical protein